METCHAIPTAPLPPALVEASRELGASLRLVRLAPLWERLAIGAFPLSAWLTEPEQARLAGYRYPKRRLEWLGGRLAAKLALLAFVPGHDPLRWRIDTADDGRPLVRERTPEGEAAGPEISITHSHGLAAALVADRPCGLDLQQFTPTVARVRERFCRETELTVLIEAGLYEECGQRSGLTLLWAAKEALRKGLGGTPLTGFLDMELLQVTAASDAMTTLSRLTLGGSAGRVFTIVAGRLEEHAIAFCLH